MEKIFTLLIGIVLSIAILNSQVAPPQAFSYKATFMKANGNSPLSNKTISLRINILTSGGASVYEEIFKPTTNKDGQIDIVIGRGGIGFSSIEWSIGEYFLKTEVDVNGSTNYQLLSQTQLLSVPYALYSDESGFALSADYNNLSNKPAIDGSETKITAGTNVTVTGTGTSGSPYVVNATNAGATTHYIGESYGGGIVFYVYKNANGEEHGLILSLESLGIVNFGYYWVSGIGSAWDGATNTKILIEGWSTTETDAVKLCDSYSGGGFNDWYLPAIDELHMLWNNIYIIDKTLSNLFESSNVGGINWSSTFIPFNPVVPYTFNLQDGQIIFAIPAAECNVYAVRAF
jgi:hypothetical protein